MINRIKWAVGGGVFLGLLVWCINGIAAWLKAGQLILPLGGM